jgi:CMP-N,N'-diacetyllegionaminic acid synthase
MKSLIVIPARGGSKRLKNKNKKFFLGKPLVEYTVDFAKKIKVTPYILVSTNDKDIINIVFKKKVLTPWLRPSHLSKDNSSSYSFMLHAIKWFKKTFGDLEYVILLQPTTPYRKISTIKKMISIFKKKKNSVAAFTTKLKEDKKIYYIKNKKKIVFRNKEGIKSNILGSIYINSVKNLIKYKSFVNTQTIPYLTSNPKEIIDIDTHADYKLARRLLKK